MYKRILILGVILAAPAIAQTNVPPTAQTQAAAPVEKPNPLDKIVCKTDDTSGSRLKRHKVCATVREWQEQQQDNREALDRMQQQGQANPRG